MKKFLSVILAAVMIFAVFSVASFAEDIGIESVEVNVETPVAGEELAGTFDCTTENVTVTEVKWFDVSTGEYKDEITFTEDCEYVTYVSISAEEGYVFTTETVVVINEEGVKFTLGEDGKTLKASITQYCYHEEEPYRINELSIDFITPVVGEYAFLDYILDSEDAYLSDAQWYNAETDEPLDYEAKFTKGTYYISVTFGSCSSGYFDGDTDVIINGSAAKTVTVNEDGTLTATAEFECEGGHDVLSVFAKIINAVKTAFVTFIRFIGAFLGLK